jgi:serine protease Do
VAQLMAEFGGGGLFVVNCVESFRPAGRLLRFIAIVVGSGSAWAAPGDPAADVSVPCVAERISVAAPAHLLQLRTRVADAERQSSISGFLVAADRLAITNCHVVSRVAFDPKTYSLEHTTADGSHGEAQPRRLTNDLTVVGLDKRDAPFFAFDVAGDSARSVGSRRNLRGCDCADRLLGGASVRRAA